jgi:putative peptidoglycan lipid II flippase
LHDDVASEPADVPRRRTAGFVGVNAGLSGLHILLALGVQLVLASRLGASRDMDVFLSVTGLVAAVRGVVGSCLPQSFVPILKQAEQDGSPHAMMRIAWSVSSLLLIVFGPVALALLVFAEPITKILVPGFDDASLRSAGTLLRIVAFAVVFDALRGLAVSFSYARNRFALPGLTVSFQHVALAAGVFLLYPRYGVDGLGWAWLIGSIGMLIGLMSGMWSRLFQVPTGGLQQIGRLRPVVPVFAVALLSELRLPLERFLASYLGEGGVSYLGYSNRILQTMYACLPMAIALAYFPQFSTHAARGDAAELRRTFSEALRAMILVIVPMLVLTATLRAPIIEMLFERGRFTHATTVAVSETLLVHLGVFAGLGISALAYNLFFARAQIAPLVVIECVCLVCLAALGQLLMRRWGYVGIAVAGSVVGLVRGAASLIAVQWKFMGFETQSFLRCLGAAVMGGAAMWTVMAALMAMRTAGSRPEPFVAVAAVSAMGAATYVAVLWLQGVPELKQSVRYLAVRVRERRV